MEEYSFFGKTSRGHDRVGKWSISLVPDHERQTAFRADIPFPSMQREFERRLNYAEQRITYGYLYYKGYFILVERAVRDPAARVVPSSGKYELVVERRTEDGLADEGVSVCAMVDLWAAAGASMMHIHQLMRGQIVTEFGEPTNRAPRYSAPDPEPPIEKVEKKRPMTNLYDFGRPVSIKALLFRARADSSNSLKPSTIRPKEDVETLLWSLCPEGNPADRRVTRRRSN